jgi:metal-responsive CopG/Arc/MetJ family transcriptional regulator
MGKIKTTINIDEDLWKKFSILVIEEHGHRKKNEIIEQLIGEYVRKGKKTHN